MAERLLQGPVGLRLTAHGAPAAIPDGLFNELQCNKLVAAKSDAVAVWAVCKHVIYTNIVLLVEPLAYASRC